jgi:hypothetical protein
MELSALERSKFAVSVVRANKCSFHMDAQLNHESGPYELISKKNEILQC